MKKLCLFIFLITTLNLSAAHYIPYENSLQNTVASSNVNSSQAPDYTKLFKGNLNWQEIGKYIMTNAPEKIKNASNLDKTKYLNFTIQENKNYKSTQKWKFENKNGKILIKGTWKDSMGNSGDDEGEEI